MGSDSDSLSVTGLLRGCVERHPDRTFLDLDGQTYTYAEVWQRSLEVAGGLAALGVRPGQTVVSMQDTHIDGAASWFGTNLLGGIWVGTNTALRGEFLRHVVSDADAAVVLCEQDFVERFTAVADGLPKVTTLLHRGAPLDWDRTRLRIEPFADHRAPLGRVHEAAADDLTCLTYTGGTTGPSKGCMIPHGYAINIARRGLVQTQRTADELNWNPLPMFHLNVLAMTVVATMLVGGTAALAPRFSVSRFWPEIERTGARVVNLIGGLPTMIAQAPDNPEMARCYGQIRMVHCVPFPEPLQQVWRTRFGVKIPGAKGFGMTEVFPVTFQAPNDEAPPESAGRPSDTDLEVRIVDDGGAEVPAGAVGEVVCRPRRDHVMFAGYWRRPEATAEAMRAGWFHTGDLGRFDEAGYFYFVDRKHDYLRRRGENISSQELEVTYLAHPDLRQVAVHAVRSDLGATPGSVGGAVPGSPPLVATGNATPVVFTGRLPLGPSGRSLYLVLALAALLALGCARLMKEPS